MQMLQESARETKRACTSHLWTIPPPLVVLGTLRPLCS